MHVILNRLRSIVFFSDNWNKHKQNKIIGSFALGYATKVTIGLQNSVGKRSEPESLVHIGFFDENW